MLAAAAMKAVRRWRYEPYRLQGEPGELKTNVTVNFKLSPHVNPCRESTSDSPAAVEPGTGVGYGTAGFKPDPLIAKVGPGITPPKAIYAPDPKYSGRTRKAKYQGTVLLWAVVGADGRVQDLKVAPSLGMGLDENAVAAVCKWKFKAAMKDSQPIPVQINVEVNFRLD